LSGGFVCTVSRRPGLFAVAVFEARHHVNVRVHHLLPRPGAHVGQHVNPRARGACRKPHCFDEAGQLLQRLKTKHHYKNRGADKVERETLTSLKKMQGEGLRNIRGINGDQ